MLGCTALAETPLASSSYVVSGSGSQIAANLSESASMAETVAAAATLISPLSESLVVDGIAGSYGLPLDEGIFEAVGTAMICFVDGAWLVEVSAAADWQPEPRSEGDWSGLPKPPAIWSKQ